MDNFNICAEYPCSQRAMGKCRGVSWMIQHDQYWITNQGEGPGSGVVGGEMFQPLFHGPFCLWSPFIPRSPLRPVGYSIAKNGYFYDRNQRLWEWVGNKECSQTSQWQIVVKLLDFDVGKTNTYNGSRMVSKELGMSIRPTGGEPLYPWLKSC